MAYSCSYLLCSYVSSLDDRLSKGFSHEWDDTRGVSGCSNYEERGHDRMNGSQSGKNTELKLLRPETLRQVQVCPTIFQTFFDMETVSQNLFTKVKKHRTVRFTSVGVKKN